MTTLSFACRHRYPDGFELDIAFETSASITAVVGPSGSGKSTLLALIAGTLRPVEGTIALGARTLVDCARGVCVPPEARRLGVVFQDGLLFPHRTVKGNLEFGLRRRSGASLTELARAVELLELGALLERYPHTLSGGEQQRTALGRALLSDPQLLLLDEPLSSLDRELKERVLGYLERAIAAFGIPALFVSHDEAELSRLAAPTIRLAAGRLAGA